MEGGRDFERGASRRKSCCFRFGSTGSLETVAGLHRELEPSERAGGTNSASPGRERKLGRRGQTGSGPGEKLDRAELPALGRSRMTQIAFQSLQSSVVAVCEAEVPPEDDSRARAS